MTDSEVRSVDPAGEPSLGTNAHLFARRQRRDELIACFETALRCGPVRTVAHPGMSEPMLLVGFPGGGHLSIEFRDDAPDDDHPRLGAWLEVRVADPDEVMRSVLAAGLRRIEHPGHQHYFMAPGGQVFALVGH